MKKIVAFSAAIALLPAPAAAHLVASGMGSVYDGIAHFILSPEDFLPLIGFAFLAGLRGPAHARFSLAAVAAGWAAGAIAALAGIAFAPIAMSMATALLFLAVGGLLAANVDLSTSQCVAIGLSLGFVRGMGDFQGASGTVAAWLTLLGVCASVFVAFALAASVTLPLKRLWLIVAARVGGSWLAALGLLFVGWIARYGSRIH